MKIMIILTIILFHNLLYANELKKVSLQLQWKHQFQFAGYYIAKEKGFYKDVGLDVNIKEFDYGINPIDEVINNKSTYATGRSSLIIEKSKGKPINALAAIFQSSPLVLIASPKSGIKTIKDLKNKSIMLSPDESTTVSINAMLSSQGLSLKDMKKLKHSFNINDLLNGTTHISSAYSSVQPFKFIEKGITPLIFDPKDYGFDFYNDILFTSTYETVNHPKRVKSFREASLMGWEYAFNNIEETIEIILEKYNSQNKTKEELFFEAKKSKELAFYKVDKIGEIKKEKFEKVYDIYNVMGYIKNDIDFNEFIFNPDKNHTLTKEEKSYLAKKIPIKICIDNSWMPFEARDKNGNHIGISADYFKLFSEVLNTEFQVIKTHSWSESLEFAKQRKCDILSLAMQTPQRKKYMNFTSPYLRIPLVIATKINKPFIDNLQLLKNKKVAIPKGYAFVEILKKNYPNLTIIEVENIDEGLKKVNKNEVFGYIGTLASVGYQFQTKFNGELKIAGKFDKYWELGIAVRNDDNILLSIMQKAIDSLNPKQQQTILNNWISIKYENGVDYNLIFKIISVSILILLIFTYWNRKLNNSKKQLEKVNKKNEHYLKLIDNNVLISTSDTKGVITGVSEALCKLTGYTKKELIGKSHNIFRHKDMPSSAFKDMWKTISIGKVWQGEVKNLNKDGSYYWADVKISANYNDLQQIIGYSAVRQNITDKKRLEKISITDPLTKAFNRLYLDQNYTSEIQRAKRYKKELSIILIDIDNFKKINDNYGHNIGDIVLKKIANILKKNIRKVDKLGRWGGEEFLIICPETNLKNAQILAENLRKLISQHDFSDIDNITCSFGVTMFDLNDKKDETFIRVDKALYEAKKIGKNKVVVL